MVENESDPTPFPGHDLRHYGPGPGLGCAVCGCRGAALSYPCGSRCDVCGERVDPNADACASCG